jgi:hypothetical protein
MEGAIGGPRPLVPAPRARALRGLALGAVALCFLALWLAPSAHAAEPLGGIEGKVTDASSHAPVAGIEVVAITTSFELLGEEESEYEHVFGEATTGAGGEYKIPALRPGTYYVEFGATEASGLNYIDQFYDDTTGLQITEATQVTVTAEKTTPEIDAALSPGGEITGTVTNASTGAPVDEAFACALTTNANGKLQAVACTESGANGEYTLRGLPTGSYKLGFFGKGFEVQYYKDKTSGAEAEAVSVTAPEVTSGIDEAMTPGSQAPEQGPPSSTTEAASTTTSKLESDPLTTQAQKEKGPDTTLSLLDKRVVVASDGDAVVRLSCTGAVACGAKLTFGVQKLVKVNGKKALRTVTIGKSTVLSIGAGKHLTLRIKLDSAARRLLRDHGRLDVKLVLKTLAGERDENVVLIAQH